jgi:Fe2+ transport system protein FeoA
MEAHAPFGGLLRIRILETSISIHRDDAANILIRREKNP